MIGTNSGINCNTNKASEKVEFSALDGLLTLVEKKVRTCKLELGYLGQCTHIKLDSPNPLNSMCFISSPILHGIDQ